MSKAQGKFDFSVHHPFKSLSSPFWCSASTASYSILQIIQLQQIVLTRCLNVCCHVIGWLDICI